LQAEDRHLGAPRRAGRREKAIAVGLEGAEDARRAGLDLAPGIFCALNATVAAFELGRWELIDRVTDEVLAREPTGMSLLSGRCRFATGAASSASAWRQRALLGKVRIVRGEMHASSALRQAASGLPCAQDGRPARLAHPAQARRLHKTEAAATAHRLHLVP
jgi:hypothetical protein